MSTSKTTKLKAISIFTGAGGLDIGFENAGFDIISATEIHPVYCKTLEVNQQKKISIKDSEECYLQNTTLLNNDINDLGAKDLLQNYNGDIDCLIGGPPCQSFSSAGKQCSIFDDRGKLVYQYFRILKELQPKTFLFENVRGLVTARGKNKEPGEVLMELLEMFDSIGYSCKVSLLNSADYGSYQRRVRCIIVGSRIAEAPNFPRPMFSEHGEEMIIPELSTKPWRTLGDFLNLYADNNEEHWTLPTPALKAQLLDIPEGKGLRSQGRAEATRPGGHWGYRQGTFIADKSKPARTVTGSSSQDWIRLNDGTLRRLTLREVSKLQGFPNEWEFCGSVAQQFQQVGNAVPTILGEVMGNTISHYLLHGYKNMHERNQIEISADIQRNIKYTKYDSAVNGAYRVNRINSMN